MVSIRTYRGRTTFIHKARNLLRAHIYHLMIPHLSSDGSTIAEVPESLMFTTKWLSDVSQMYPHIHALHHSSETPIHSSSGPAANALSSESNTQRAIPPFEAHTPVRLMPTNANATYTPPAPSTQHQTYAPASFRLLYFAPPMQSMSLFIVYADALNRDAGTEMRSISCKVLW